MASPRGKFVNNEARSYGQDSGKYEQRTIAPKEDIRQA